MNSELFCRFIGFQAHGKDAFVPRDLKGSLAQIVREHRRELRITQEYLGLLAGVSERTIRDLEKGRESIAFDKVTAVLDTLGIDLIPRER